MFKLSRASSLIVIRPPDSTLCTCSDMTFRKFTFTHLKDFKTFLQSFGKSGQALRSRYVLVSLHECRDAFSSLNIPSLKYVTEVRERPAGVAESGQARALQTLTMLVQIQPPAPLFLELSRLGDFVNC